jgi:hypothetical protein
VAEIERHQDRQQRPPEARQSQGQTAPALQAIEHRADERGDDGERRDGDDEVEQHASGRLRGGRGEEQRAGERHRQYGVDGVVRHHGIGEGGQT